MGMTATTKWTLGFAMAAMLAGCGEAGSSMQKGFEDGFKSQFVDNFAQSCQSSAGGSGLAADKIAEVCKCTAEALVGKYETSDLMNMKPEDALPVMKECAAKSGVPL